jgi:hypothetical protein
MSAAAGVHLVDFDHPEVKASLARAADLLAQNDRIIALTGGTTSAPNRLSGAIQALIRAAEAEGLTRGETLAGLAAATGWAMMEIEHGRRAALYDAFTQTVLTCLHSGLSAEETKRNPAEGNA